MSLALRVSSELGTWEVCSAFGATSLWLATLGAGSVLPILTACGSPPGVCEP